jgi:hypothetical protein
VGVRSFQSLVRFASVKGLLLRFVGPGLLVVISGEVAAIVVAIADEADVTMALVHIPIRAPSGVVELA